MFVFVSILWPKCKVMFPSGLLFDLTVEALILGLDCPTLIRTIVSESMCQQIALELLFKKK